MRLSQIARKLNIRTDTIIDYLEKQGIQMTNNPNAKLDLTQLKLLEKAFSASLTEKQKADKLVIDLPTKQPNYPKNKLQQSHNLEQKKIESKKDETVKKPYTKEKPSSPTYFGGLKMLGKIKLDDSIKKRTPQYQTTHTPIKKNFTNKTPYTKLSDKKLPLTQQTPSRQYKPQIKKSKYQQEKKARLLETQQIEQEKARKEQKILKLTDNVTANQLASLMDIPVHQLLSTCMDLGIISSINQRLHTDTVNILAEELGFEVQFITEKEKSQEIPDKPEDLLPRPPIVTVMGHVDHGKTSLLDYIRKEQVSAHEAGNITQHIGAYQVHTKNQQSIVFLDTPGHEAFTAMRARGVQLTDIAIIIIAADDGVMPQTKEAISHAQIANTPIIIAINKIDKPNADPQKIKEQLSQLNIITEDWGGKYQCQEISAKKGIGVEQLLEKILLEAELLSLKANPNKKAKGIVIEASLDQGRGYVTNIMVKQGTLHKGDIILAGPYFGKIKAMFDATKKSLTQALPSTPVQVLGLNGAPHAGQNFIIIDNKQTAREQAVKNAKMLRSQEFQVQRNIKLQQVHQTLDSASESIQQLNILIKADVDGSIEALADSLLKLSTEKIHIRVIYKAVGQISESDVILATTCQAIIIGFQTKITPKARTLANEKRVNIKTYTIIYDAIEYITQTIQSMLTPEKQEAILISKAEVIKTFTIPHIGTIAGCKVVKGTIHQNQTVEVKRKEKTLYKGPIKELQKKGKPIQQAKQRTECGIRFENFNDLLIDDIIEVIQ